MKAILEFNLPEEKSEYNLATHGYNYWQCLWDLDQQLRTFIKHDHKFKSIDEALHWVRSEINENVDLDEIE